MGRCSRIVGTYKTSTCRDRRKKARGMDREEDQVPNSCGPRWHSGITSISVKKESQPTGNLSCEGHQEQRHILLKGNSPINQKVQKPEGGVCITLLFLIPEPSSCSYPVP